MKPTKYTRTENAHWIRFDAESDPATWPEGVRYPGSFLIRSEKVKRSVWVEVHHGDMLRVEPISTGKYWIATNRHPRTQGGPWGWIEPDPPDSSRGCWSGCDERAAAAEYIKELNAGWRAVGVLSAEEWAAQGWQEGEAMIVDRDEFVDAMKGAL